MLPTSRSSLSSSRPSTRNRSATTSRPIPKVQLYRGYQGSFPFLGQPPCERLPPRQRYPLLLGHRCQRTDAWRSATLGDTSGTGVAFTRNPATGEKELMGEFLMNAQGEDVVAGVRTPMPIEKMTGSSARGLRAVRRQSATPSRTTTAICRTWSSPSRTRSSTCSRPVTVSVPLQAATQDRMRPRRRGHDLRGGGRPA